MTTHALAMPPPTKQLIILQLTTMGLDVSNPQREILVSPLSFEDGTVLLLVIMCASKRSWFTEKPLLAIAVMSASNDMRPSKIYSRETMPMPSSPNDVQFMLRLAAKVTATVWSLAAVLDIGECVSLPGRPGGG